MKGTSTKPARMIAAGFLITAGLLAAMASPASATTSTMSCNGYSATILNGNVGDGTSIARTVDDSDQCATISHSAYTNQYGTLVYTSRGGYSTAQTVTRTFYGAMNRSNHYHNGNAFTQLWN